MKEPAFDFDVAVVGAGPGGLVSALYLRRFLRSVIVVSDGIPRASWIPKTHNVLGYRAGISGQELLKRLNGQLNDLDTERRTGDFKVMRIPAAGYRLFQRSGKFQKVGQRKNEVTARKVILATGMTDLQPDIKNLDELRQKGFFRYCPVCDAYEFRRKRIFVLASGRHGLNTSRFLSDYSDSINVLWHSQKPPDKKISEELRLRGVRIHPFALQNVKITARNKMILSVKGNFSYQKDFEADVCYVALGSSINDRPFRHFKSLRRDDQGFLITDSHQELSMPGIFAVGDCVSGLAQISVAAGQAAVAATRIHHQLSVEN